MNKVWVFGPLPDLLLGCGVGYVLLAMAVSTLPADYNTLLLWGAVLTLFTSMPHYGATLLRVYEHRDERRRYAFFAVWLTLLIWGVFVWGVYDRLVGSLFVTLYLAWSPWHYSGQNYGLAVMFLRRGGVDLDAGTKRVLYATFMLSFALALITLVSDPSAASYSPTKQSWTYRLILLRLPLAMYGSVFLSLLGLYLASLALAIWRLRRAGRVLLPVGMLLATQAMWFSIPSAVIGLTDHALGEFDVAFAFVWIGIGHAIQYLWITTYYAVRSGGAGERARYYGKALCAGAIVWVIPALVFSPVLLGDVTYSLGLYLMVAAAANLQHFVLDGAIWKLRDGRVARILLAKTPERPQAIDAGSRWRIGRPAILLVGAACAVISITSGVLENILRPSAIYAGDSLRAERLESWLTWLGREEPSFYNRRARELIERGDPRGATELFHRSLALYPNPEAWIGIAEVRFNTGDPAGALAALRKSLQISPTAHAWSAIGTVERERGNLAEARKAFRKAAALAPQNAEYSRLSLNSSDYERDPSARTPAANPSLSEIGGETQPARKP